jgi:hypothetical protein
VPPPLDVAAVTAPAIDEDEPDEEELAVDDDELIDDSPS